MTCACLHACMSDRSDLGSGFSTLIAGTILIVIGQVLIMVTLSLSSCKTFFDSQMFLMIVYYCVYYCCVFIRLLRSNYTKILLECCP